MNGLPEAAVARGIMTEEQATAFAERSGIVPDTILWSCDKELEEDAFRSGAKKHAAIDFLRWQDIGKEETRGKGRIPEDEWHLHAVEPGRGISMFIKKILPAGFHWVSSGPATGGQKNKLKEDYDPLTEKFWWKLEKGQPLPAGLVLKYDGVPPGHCTLTVTREVMVDTFLELVSQLKLTNAGCDLFGIVK